VVPVIAWALAQTLKFIIRLSTIGEVDFAYLLNPSGMPSSHSALVASLTTAVGIAVGVGSPLFAICCILTAIVVYDAVGIRQALGQQASVLNQILKNSDRGDSEIRLRELIGHSVSEVLVGCLLGIGLTFFWNYFIRAI